MNPCSTCDLRPQMHSALLLRTATSTLYCLLVSLGAPAPVEAPPLSWGPVYDVTSSPSCRQPLASFSLLFWKFMCTGLSFSTSFQRTTAG